MALSNGNPSLYIKYIQKSKEFIKANCFDKNSKLFFLLNNRKIVTLLHLGSIRYKTIKVLIIEFYVVHSCSYKAHLKN
jgi:hypothetical protein